MKRAQPIIAAAMLGVLIAGLPAMAEFPRSENYYLKVAGLNEGGAGFDLGTEGDYHQRRHSTNFKMIDALGQPLIMGEPDRPPFSSAGERRIYSGALLAALELENTFPSGLECESAENPVDVAALTPRFTAVFNGPDVGGVADKYRLQVSRDDVFSDLVWESGVGGTAMAEVTDGGRCGEIIYGGNRLYTDGSGYFWRINFWDTVTGEGTWSAPATFTMFDSVPTAPTGLECEGEAAPGGVVILDPEFSAVFNDPAAGDNALYYHIQISADDGFTSLVWDTGLLGMLSLPNGEIFSLEYSGDALLFDGSTYYWRIRFEDDTGNVGVWSEAGEFSMINYTSAPQSPENLRVRGQVDPIFTVRALPVFTAVYRDEDLTDIADRYWVQVSRQSDFTTLAWDSGEAGTEMERVDRGMECGGITGPGDLDPYGRYYWRIKFWDIQGYEGQWSSEEAWFGYDLGFPGSQSFTLETWGLNEGGTANYPAGKRQKDAAPYYYLVDSVGPEAVSLGSDDLPYLTSAGFHGYSHVLLAGLDTTIPSTPGQPETETPTQETKPEWSWTAATDNVFGSGLDPVFPYLVFWSRDEGGEDYRSRAGSNSYIPDVALDFGQWYFTVAAVDREGNRSAPSTSGLVNILDITPTPSPTPSVTPSPTATATPSPSVTATPTPTATPDGGCQIDLTVYLHGYLNETDLTQRPATLNVEFRTVQDQAGPSSFDLDLNTGGRGVKDLWPLAPESYYLLIRQKLSGTDFGGEAIPPGSNHLSVVTSEPREFIEGIVTEVNLSDAADPAYIGVYVSDHEQASSPMISSGTSGRYWMLGGGDADGNQLINVADILKWDTLVGFPDADDRGEARFSDQGNFDGNDKIDGYDFNVWKRMVNEGVTYAPLP